MDAKLIKPGVFYANHQGNVRKVMRITTGGDEPHVQYHDKEGTHRMTLCDFAKWAVSLVKTPGSTRVDLAKGQWRTQ